MSTLLCARAASAHSPLRFSENPLPVRGEPACGSSCDPVSRCRKRSRPSGANTLTQFVCPGNSVQKKEPALQRAPKREDRFDFNLLRYPAESPS